MIFKVGDVVHVDGNDYRVETDLAERPFIKIGVTRHFLKNFNFKKIDGKIVGTRKDFKKFLGVVSHNKETLRYEVFAERLALAKNKIAFLLSRDLKISISVAQAILKRPNTLDLTPL